MLNGRCAPVQWAAESPRVVRRTAPSNTRIKLTAKLKSLKAFSLLAAYPPPIRRMPYGTINCNFEKKECIGYKLKSIIYVS